MRTTHINILALGIAFVIIGGTIFYIKQPDEATPEPVATIATTPTQVTETDSDGDGLKDWEETLWGTRASNPDTDGDGTSDGAEIAANRDPNKPGPNDAITATSSISITASNDSESIAQNLFGEILLGSPTSTIASNTVSSIQSAASQFTPLTTDDIIVVTATDASFSTYGARLTQILTSISTDDFQINTGTGITDPEAVAAFAKLADAYQTTYEALRLVSVPASAATYHLDFTNAVGATIGHIRDIEGMSINPLVGVNALVAFAESATEVNKTRNSLEVFLTTVSSYEPVGNVY